MPSLRRSLASALLALTAALILAVGAWPARALAEPNTVFTATATPSYRNPTTGVIEDSGGEAQEALGQSMTESATYPAALVEYDANDEPFVTLRLQLMDHISGVQIAVDDGTGEFYDYGYNEMQNTGTTADFQVSADPSSVFRVQMYVSDMGREVIFYITLSDLVPGNSQGFVQSVDTNATSEATDASGAAAAPAAASASAPAATSAAAATGAKAATTGQKVASAAGGSAGSSTTSADGIQEFDANGNAGDSSSDGMITVPVMGLVVGLAAGIVIGVVAIALAAGLGIWIFAIRNRAAIERANNAATLAAAGAGGAPVARPHATPVESASSAGDSVAPDELDVTTVMPEPRPSKGPRDGVA